MSAFPILDRAGNAAARDRAGLVLLDFWQQTCAPCRALEPRLELFARRRGDEFTGYRIDVDADPDRAAAGDAVMIIAVAAAGRPLRRRSVGRWLSPAAELTATAAAVELLALVMGRWSYSDAMPTIGTVGVSPLLQLPVTGTVALLVGRRCGMRSASLCLTSANVGP